MRKETDFTKVKDIAKAFLHMDYEISALGTFLLIHPVFDSCYQGYFEDGETKLVNIIEDKIGFQKVVANYEKIIEDANSIPELLLIIRKAYWLTFFKYTNTYLSKEDYSKTLAEIWVESENPNQDANVTITKAAGFFRRGDKKIMMNEEEYAYYESLPEIITVYRGVSPGRAKDGLSWTDDKEKAIWFANRFATENQQGYLLAGKVDKEDVLAYFNGRNESELVIHPKSITNLTKEYLQKPKK